MTSDSIDLPPKLSVIVCTRNRGSQIAATIESVLAISEPAFELILVDQNTDPESAQVVARYRDDPRFVYVRTSTHGKGVALNIGVAKAQGEIICFTDDDCTVPTNWLAVLAAPFAAQHRVAISFGNVLAGPHDKTAGFIPEYIRQGNQLLGSFYKNTSTRPMGASMAVRSSVLKELHGFDEFFGPGAIFPSADELDLELRILLRRWLVYETDQVSITHHGFRTWQQGKELTRRDWYAIGGVYAKLIKCGSASVAVLALNDFFVSGIWGPIVKIVHGQSHPGFRRTGYFLQGLARGLQMPVDREAKLFRVPPMTAETPTSRANDKTKYAHGSSPEQL